MLSNKSAALQNGNRQHDEEDRNRGTTQGVPGGMYQTSGECSLC